MFLIMWSEFGVKEGIDMTHNLLIIFVDLVAHLAGKTVAKRHDLTKPQGVRGRNSDNTRLRTALGWEPATSLEHGLSITYRWIESQLRQTNGVTAASAYV